MPSTHPPERASPRVLIGTAGWSITRAVGERFPGAGSQLARYAARLAAVEINSSFYRPHRPATYARWAESTPATFRFAVKLPRAITHDARLARAGPPLDVFLAEAGALGQRLGALLVQLPPSFAYEGRVVGRFLAALRDRWAGAVVLEPRHASWFTAAVSERLAARRIARVAADPARVPEAAEPGGDRSVVYYRLHGSPRIYWSRYDEAFLDALAARLRTHLEEADRVWCIFDNTASGAAIENALALEERVG
ncbi:MAG TPA: DUF72 domain-containing protein [Gemmatimonadaceae bacterium]|nr:DUF72 domain-containing protein [Gemmatimonadaceae bacterium]